MNHQPFESWIYNESNLSGEEQIQLNQHLADCSKCRHKQIAWKSVRRAITNMPMVPPAPNFARRWRESIPRRIKQKQENQVRLFFILLFGFSFLVTAVLVTIMILTNSPIGWVSNILTTLSETTLIWNQITNSIVLLVKAIPTQTMRTLWIIGTSTVSLLTLFWFGAIYRIMKRNTKGVKA